MPSLSLGHLDVEAQELLEEKLLEQAERELDYEWFQWSSWCEAAAEEQSVSP